MIFFKHQTTIIACFHVAAFGNPVFCLHVTLEELDVVEPVVANLAPKGRISGKYLDVIFKGAFLFESFLAQALVYAFTLFDSMSGSVSPCRSSTLLYWMMRS